MGKRTLGRTRSRLEDNIKIYLQELGWGYGLNSYGSGWGQVGASCEFLMNVRVPYNVGKFLTS